MKELRAYLIQFSNTPKIVGLVYVLLVLIFGVIYWICPWFSLSGQSNERLSFFQGIYFSVVTITTLGYGDILPTNDAARITVSLESLFGIVLIGFFLNAVANAHARREHELELLRESERLVPIIDLIGKRILSLSTCLNGGIYHITDTSSSPNIQLINQFMGRAKSQLQKLSTLTDLNSAALSNQVLPSLVEIIELSEQVLLKQQFLVNIYTSDSVKKEYVLKSPIEDLKIIEEKIQELMARYNGAIIDSRPDATKVQMLEPRWESLVNTTQVFDNLEKYVYPEDKVVFFFDIPTMTSTMGAKVGASVEVFYALN